MKNRILIYIILLIIIGFSITPVIYAVDKESGCITCHEMMGDDLAKPVELAPRDLHTKKNLGCSDCHGGNPNTDDFSEAKDETFIGKPTPAEIPEFCGRCHSDSVYMKNYNPALPTDQLDKYKTSLHGQKLVEGDEKVATCVSCHSVHDIQPAAEPKSTVNPFNIPATCGKCHNDAAYMEEYGIPTNQLDEYSKSVHGIALLEKKDDAAPACNDCHGNHTAAPPEVSMIGYVCGRCHTLTSNYYENSPHKPVFDDMGFKPCETCHGNHNIQPVTNAMLGMVEPAVCTECHSDGDGTPGPETARFMRAKLDELEQKKHDINEVIHKSEMKGIDVEDLQLQIRDVHQVITQSQTAVHSFNLETFKSEIDKGFKTVGEVETLAQKAIDEFRYRQRGYAIATLTLTL
ncbi:cytochrome c3 family protein, partial [bacterium]|nr:cytochrome c3 family protein [bacterium]MBU1025221.1 cytochrome c3 family protein [bacterium]